MDKDELFKSMKNILDKLLKQTDSYTLIFKQKDFFTFSDIEERRKIYKREYYSFICDFNTAYSSLKQHISEIVTLFLDSDRNANEEKTILFKSIFEKHLLLEKELLVFTSTTEKELSEKEPSVSLLLDSANRLSISIRSLLDSLPS